MTDIAKSVKQGKDIYAFLGASTVAARTLPTAKSVSSTLTGAAKSGKYSYATSLARSGRRKRQPSRPPPTRTRAELPVSLPLSKTPKERAKTKPKLALLAKLMMLITSRWVRAAKLSIPLAVWLLLSLQQLESIRWTTLSKPATMTAKRPPSCA
jgi:hypothetical protein